MPRSNSFRRKKKQSEKRQQLRAALLLPEAARLLPAVRRDILLRVPATVSGGGGGSSIASTGLRYVGNPYVYGGNSLTNGTDCSGFVHLIHSACGISTPRDSNSLAGGGRAVSESEMLPGDVVCYYGHVGIYIGNGQIVHASTPSSGIKVSNMYYRSIRCVRRYW